MLYAWTIVALIVAALIALAAIILRWVRGIGFSRASILSATAALITLQTLFFLRGSFAISTQDAPPMHDLLLAGGIILACNAAVELAKWAIIRFVVTPQHLTIPLFLLDLIGWIVLIVIGLVVISEIFNLELTGLLVGSTVVSAIIALSLQQILSSLFAGISLQIEGPFQADDWVELDGQEGRVVRQNWRTLAVVTRKNEYVILPNGVVAQGKIVNYSRPNRMIAHDLFIGVAHSHPPGEVKSMLQAALAGIDGIETSRPPQVIVYEYADFFIKYRVRFWMRDYSKKMALHDIVATRLWYALDRAGISIPLPIRDVNLRLVTEEDELQLEAERQHTIVKGLRPIPLFAALTDEQIEQIAAGARLQRYSAGETLVQEGDAGDSLFIIKAGQVGVFVEGTGGRAVPVTQRCAGEYFGEMSLLTGEPRSASVVAETETEVVIIDKLPFGEVLAAEPDILESLLDALDRRRSVVQSRLVEDSASARQKRERERTALLQRIVSFLGIAPTSSEA